MTASDEQLRLAVLETTYGTALERFGLRSGPDGEPSWAANGGVWAVITAWNPGGRRVSDPENRARDEALQAALLTGHRRVLHGTNREGPWDEPSYVVPGLGLRGALTLGRSFGQAAVLWAHGRRVALAWCDPVRVERRWFARITPGSDESTGPMP